MTKAELIAANNEWRQQLEDAKKRESIAYNIIDQQRRIIDEQRREIDELKEALREATEWISVDDRLPEYEDGPNPKTRYLVKIVSGSILSQTTISVGWLRNRYKWNGEIDWVRVTHWRPITSPKAEQILKKFE